MKYFYAVENHEEREKNGPALKCAFNYLSRYTGLLAASMTGAQFLTSFAWGRCSDVIGRKPVMLIGNLAGALGMLALGYSPTFAWALTSRFISGLFNGTSV